MSVLSSLLGSIFGGGNNAPPMPGRYTSQPAGSPLPLAGGAPGGVPAGLPPGFNAQQFVSQLQTNPDLAGVWQTIQGLGGDVWGVLGKILPHGADGSVDWGALGKDVGSALSWVGSHASDLTAVAGAIGNYQRQQQSDKYAQQALNGLPGAPGSGAIAEFNANAPLRTAGRAGMLDPSARTPDLSSLKNMAGANSGNPFANALPLAQPKPPVGALPLASGTLPGPSAPSPMPGTPGPLPLLPGSVPLPGQPALPPGAANGLQQSQPQPTPVNQPPSSMHGLPVTPPIPPIPPKPRALPLAAPSTPIDPYQPSKSMILPLAQ